MALLLVNQLRFARSELLRCLNGVSGEDAIKRILPMNSISWIVGHLANQENFYWVRMGRDLTLAPGLDDRVGYGKPASTPPLDEMWSIWREVTAAADVFLDSLNEEKLGIFFQWQGKPRPENVGTMLLRTTYHYWFHTGEAHAIRQMLGHKDLPQFVGNMSQALYHTGSIDGL